jgi:hypothetical protein
MPGRLRDGLLNLIHFCIGDFSVTPSYACPTARRRRQAPAEARLQFLSNINDCQLCRRSGRTEHGSDDDDAAGNLPIYLPIVRGGDPLRAYPAWDKGVASDLFKNKTDHALYLAPMLRPRTPLG